MSVVLLLLLLLLLPTGVCVGEEVELLVGCSQICVYPLTNEHDGGEFAKSTVLITSKRDQK